MPSLPPILDIRDDLTRARKATDADVDAEFRTIRDRLDAFADREDANRTGIVDEIDNQLLRLETRLDGEAARRIGAARNRLHIYRQSREETLSALSIIDSTARERGDTEREPDETDRETGGEVLPVGEVTVTVTVANSGDAREVVPVVTVYDERNDEVGSARGSPTHLEPGEERPIRIDVDVPDDAVYYATSVVEADTMSAT